jgi:mono/diheme cytochrome c family protein
MQSIYFVDKVHNRAAGSRLPGRMRAASIGSLVVLAMITMSLMLGAEGAHSQSAAMSQRPEASSGNAENGKGLYMKYGCYECHSLRGQGSMASGPRIGPDPIPFSALVSYVRHPAGDMPPYSNRVLSDQELSDIHSFLESLPNPPDTKTILLLQ